MKDEIITILVSDAAVAYVARTKHIVKRAAEIHNLGLEATHALGRTLTMAAMLGTRVKSDAGNVTINIKGGGPLGTICAVGRSNGDVKGTVSRAKVTVPSRADGSCDIGAAVGREGMLSLVRDFGSGEPYAGMVELASGEIAEDFAYYFYTSEQQPSLVSLGVRFEGAEITSAGGVLVQPFPGTDERFLRELETLKPIFADISGLLQNEDDIFEIAQVAFVGFKVQELSRMDIAYNCDCSRERVERALISLGSDELEDMINEKKGAHICCHFCLTEYNYSDEELEGLLEAARSAPRDAEMDVIR